MLEVKVVEEIDEIKQVYAEFGLAANLAQCLEYDIVSLMLVNAILTDKTLTRGDLKKLEGHWDKKTLGILLKPVKGSATTPKDLKDFVETVRLKRNSLMHSFFMEHSSDLSTPEGRSSMISELQEVSEILQRAQEMFNSATLTLMEELEINKNIINQKLAKLLPFKP